MKRKSTVTTRLQIFLISHSNGFTDFVTKLNSKVSVFSPNTGKYGPEITTYLDTFHAMKFNKKLTDLYFMTSN